MTSLRFIRLCLTLPIVIPIALAMFYAESNGGFVWQVLLLASTPYVPVALYVWWRLAYVPSERARAKLLVQALAVVILLVGVDLVIEYNFGALPSFSIWLVVTTYTAAVSCVYICVAILVYLWLRAAGVFARATNVAS